MANELCSALDSLFTSEAGRIASEIQQRLSGKNVVLDHIEKGPWEDGMGDIVNVLTVERSFTTGTNDDDTWAAVAPSEAGDNGVCLPDVVSVTTGQTQRQMQLYRRAIESPDICLELLRPGFSITNQLDITYQQLTNGLQWELEKHAINEYIRLSGNLVNVNSVDQGSTITTGAAGFDTTYVPDAVLDQGFLDAIYYQMDREVCGDGAMGLAEGQNIYTLLCEPETSQSLKRDNAEIRQDLRYAFQGDKMESELLRPYGVGGRSYGNFAHVISNKMPRYDFVDGEYVRRNYWDISPATTKGVAPKVSSLYLNAEFTTSFIFNPKVYRWLTPGVLNAPGGNTKFTTPNYFPTQFEWKNIPNRECNPDGTIGFFRGLMAAASMPLHPNYGWVILHQRAVPTVQYRSHST